MGSNGKATIYSVAERARVSIATVSRVFQGPDKVAPLTRQRVLDAAAELDYVPDAAAASLAASRTNVLGLVLPELGGSYYAELIVGFESGTTGRGLSVMLLSGDHRPISRRVSELATRCDGLAVMNGPGLLSAAELSALARRRPLVLIASEHHQAGAMTTGNRDNARELTRHLLGHGRTRLRFVGDPDLAADGRARFQGFRDALEEAGRSVPEPVRVPYTAGGGTAVARRILRGTLAADALVCVNDDVALALQLALREGGRLVPDDVAITGWDDVAAARYTGLTTVHQPVRELGRLAAERLLDAIQGGPGAVTSAELPTSVVLRSSCGPHPAPGAIPDRPDQTSTPPQPDRVAGATEPRRYR